MQGLFAARIALESTLYIFCGLWPYSITTRIKTNPSYPTVRIPPCLWPSSITTRIKISLGIIISHLLNAHQCSMSMPRFSITIYCCPIKMSGSQFWVSSRKKRGKPADSPIEFVILYCKPKKYKLMGKGTTKKIHRREQYCRILLLSLPCQVELSFFCFDTIKLVKILHLTKPWGTYCSSETYKIY